jgi:hypothetical protein
VCIRFSRTIMATDAEKMAATLISVKKLTSRSPRQANLLDALSELLEPIANGETMAGRRDDVLECMTVDQLYHPELLHMARLPGKIFEIIILFDIAPSSSRKRGTHLWKQLIPLLYEDADDRTHAENAFAHHQRGYTPDETTLPHATIDATGHPLQPPAGRVQLPGKTLQQRWSSATKYTGGLDGWTIGKLRMEWSRAANELDIPRADLVPLLHHALDDDAQTLFDKEIDGKITQLADAFLHLDSFFNTDERQRQARTSMQALRLYHYQEKNNVNKEEALRLVKADIERLSKQGDPVYDNDRARCDIMAENVLQCEHAWAWTAIRDRTKKKMTFHQFYSDLHTDLQQHVSAGTIHLEDISKALSTPQDPVGILANLAGDRYGASPRRPIAQDQPNQQPRRDTRQSPLTPRSRLSRGNARCWRCDKNGHFMAECRNPVRSISDAIAARVRHVASLQCSPNPPAAVLVAIALEEDHVAAHPLANIVDPADEKADPREYTTSQAAQTATNLFQQMLDDASGDLPSEANATESPATPVTTALDLFDDLQQDSDRFFRPPGGC